MQNLSIPLFVTILAVAASCAKEAQKPDAKRPPAAALTDQCPAPTATAEDVGRSDAPKLGLEAITLRKEDIDVSPASYGLAANTTQIYFDAGAHAKRVGASLGLAADEPADIPEIFLLWKACQTGGENCANNGQWAKDYEFTIEDIPDFPSGVASLTMRACVHDFSTLVGEARQAVEAIGSSPCSQTKPCYCGKPVTKTVKLDALEIDPLLSSYAKTLREKKTKMLELSESYQTDAIAYVKLCELNLPTSSADLQYAINIKNTQPATQANIIEQFGYDMQDLIAAATEASQEEQKALALTAGAGAGCPPPSAVAAGGGAADDAAFGDDDLFGGSTGGKPSGEKPAATEAGAGTGAGAEPETQTEASTSTETSTDTDTDDSVDIKPAAEEDKEGEKQKMIGTGIGLIVVGAALFVSGLVQKFTGTTLESKAWGAVTRGRIGNNLAYSVREINSAIGDANRALANNKWEDFEAARGRIDQARGRLQEHFNGLDEAVQKQNTRFASDMDAIETRYKSFEPVGEGIRVSADVEIGGQKFTKGTVLTEGKIVDKARWYKAQKVTITAADDLSLREQLTDLETELRTKIADANGEGYTDTVKRGKRLIDGIDDLKMKGDFEARFTEYAKFGIADDGKGLKATADGELRTNGGTKTETFKKGTAWPALAPTDAHRTQFLAPDPVAPPAGPKAGAAAGAATARSGTMKVGGDVSARNIQGGRGHGKIKMAVGIIGMIVGAAVLAGATQLTGGVAREVPCGQFMAQGAGYWEPLQSDALDELTMAQAAFDTRLIELVEAEEAGD